jgi:hypothetical protein
MIRDPFSDKSKYMTKYEIGCILTSFVIPMIFVGQSLINTNPNLQGVAAYWFY